MIKSLMRFFGLICLNFFCLLLTISPARAQVQPSDSDSAIRAAGINTAIGQYHAFVAPVTALYNGPQYVEYMSGISVGHPFFQTPGVVMGSVVYDHILYERVPLSYDILKDRLITRDPSGALYIALSNDKISRFNIFGHTFVRMEKDSLKTSLNAGFYDQLYTSASVQLLKKEIKQVVEELNAYDGTKRTIYSGSDFYLRLDNSWHKVASKKSVLDLLKEKKQKTALRQYIRKNGLDLKHEPDRSLISIAAFFDKNR